MVEEGCQEAAQGMAADTGIKIFAYSAVCVIKGGAENITELIDCLCKLQLDW